MKQSDPCILFGITIRYFRAQMDMSQEDLADQADLDRTYISSVERGKRNVSLRNIYKLAKALQQPPHKLLQQEEFSNKEGK